MSSGSNFSDWHLSLFQSEWRRPRRWAAAAAGPWRTSSGRRGWRWRPGTLSRTRWQSINNLNIACILHLLRLNPLRLLTVLIKEIYLRGNLSRHVKTQPQQDEHLRGCCEAGPEPVWLFRNGTVAELPSKWYKLIWYRRHYLCLVKINFELDC